RTLEMGSDLNPEYVEDQLMKIADDPVKFVELQEDPDGLGGDVPLPDGSFVPRLPGFTRWIWDGEVCGSINFRWQKGSTDLPDYCLGHIGYGVFPWKRGRGYATEALGQLLPEVVKLGMPFVEFVTDPENVISQKVILKNGGVLHEKFEITPLRGGGDGLRFRIYF
ncbi:MAG: GNAT family N-acetyltransferase, partial [Actinobacteria bacterium]|nr:GNAT family N-acetyltransferase [Actinomycetota bacterium]